jgi:hypothetical protein
MSNGKYLDAVGELLEHHVIRKAVDWESPRGSRDKRNASTSRGKSFDQFERSFNLGHEPFANFEIPFAVPQSGLAEIPASWTLD